MSLLRILAVVAATLALVTGGCGGGDEGGAGAGADVAPASSALFVSLNTEFDGEQWRTAEELVRKFPGGNDAIRELLRELEEEEDVDFERDVKPAVGPEVDFILLDFGDDPSVVVLTQPRDEEEFRALVEKAEGIRATEELDDGWWVAAASQGAIDRFKEAREEESLADLDAFDDVTGDLPDDRLGTVFVNGEVLTEELEGDPETTPSDRRLLECFLSEGRVPSFGFALRAEEEGARFDATYRAELENEPESYETELAAQLPADALFVLSFNNVADQIRGALRCVGDANEDFDRQLAQFELALGVSVEDDLLPLFENESAVAVYPGPESELAQQSAELRIPTITLVTQVDDEAEALRTVNTVARRASAFTEAVQVQETDIDGVPAKRVSVAGRMNIFYAAFDGKLVVTSTEEGIRGLREQGARLSDDPIYKGARSAADAPDETIGFGYANLAEAVTYIIDLAETSGERVPEDLRENLEPLRSLFFYGRADGDMFTFEGFLEIE